MILYLSAWYGCLFFYGTGCPWKDLERTWPPENTKSPNPLQPSAAWFQGNSVCNSAGGKVYPSVVFGSCSCRCWVSFATPVLSCVYIIKKHAAPRFKTIPAMARRPGAAQTETPARYFFFHGLGLVYASFGLFAVRFHLFPFGIMDTIQTCLWTAIQTDKPPAEIQPLSAFQIGFLYWFGNQTFKPVLQGKTIDAFPNTRRN